MAYPLRSDPATSTPRSTCPKNKSNSGLRTDHTACTRERTTCSQELPPYGLCSPAQPEDATMQQLRTTVYVVHATTNETTQYEYVRSRRAQALLLQLLHRSRPDASSRTIRPTKPTSHRKAEGLEPESTRLDHGRMRTPSTIRRSRLHPTDLVPCHSTRSSRTTRPRHHHPPLGHRDFAPRQAKTTRPPSTLPTNGSFWLNWYGKPGRYRLSRACRHIGPQHTRASEMPSSRLNRTYPRGRPRWPYWITKNSLPPRPAQTFGPWNLNNFSDW